MLRVAVWNSTAVGGGGGFFAAGWSMLSSARCLETQQLLSKVIMLEGLRGQLQSRIVTLERQLTLANRCLHEKSELITQGLERERRLTLLVQQHSNEARVVFAARESTAGNARPSREMVAPGCANAGAHAGRWSPIDFFGLQGEREASGVIVEPMGLHPPGTGAAPALDADAGGREGPAAQQSERWQV